jgi:hypothetical protein
LAANEDRLRNGKRQAPENQSLVYHPAQRVVSGIEAMD